jgi:8-oxo-dGTP diphosphatase
MMGANEQGANATDGRWLVIPRTLCFVTNDRDVLLMKRGPHKRVFPNRYNGLGGHIERDEDPLNGARREVAEESGLKVDNLELRAVYNIDAGEATGIMLFVFLGESESRQLAECDEGTLHWIPQEQVNQLDLVEDLPIILPRVLAMKPGEPPLFVHVSYNSNDVIQMRFAQ